MHRSTPFSIAGRAAVAVRLVVFARSIAARCRRARAVQRSARREASSIQSIAPANIAEASGTQYFRQVVITWSIRSRGSVQRSQIMNVTPTTALTMKLHMPSRLPSQPSTACRVAA